MPLHKIREFCKILSTNARDCVIIKYITARTGKILCAHAGMRMKKALLTILTAVALLAALYIPAAQKTVGVSAQSGNIDLELLMPETYEQYLELENPSDFAVNDNYIAIADAPASGNARIYIYDRSDPTAGYRVYEHTAPATLTSLQFYTYGQETHLYFVSSGTSTLISHFAIDASGDYTATPTSVSCVSFLIANNYLYYATSTGGNITVARMNMEGFDFVGPEETLSLPDGLTATNINPFFAQSYNTGDDTVYFSANSSICSVTGDSLTATEEWPIKDSIRSFAVVGAEDVYYSNTATPPYLFLYSNGVSSEISRNGSQVENVPSMRLVGDTLYLLCGKNLQTYNPSSGTFDDYEIGKYSVSDVRLGGRAEISAYGGHMVIADAGNERVSVYDSQTNSYAYLHNLGYTPGAVCAGKDIFLIADNEANKLYIYRYDALSQENTAPAAEAEIDLGSDMLDGAYSFGYFYLLTDGSESNAAIVTEDYQLTNVLFARSYSQIAADLLGNLYLMSGGAVYSTDKNDFSAGTVASRSIHTFESVPIDLAVDYTGLLCAITPDAVTTHKSTETESTVYSITEALDSLVYSAGTPRPQSFVFDVITGESYLLGDGFIAKVSGIGAASLHNLSAEGIYDDLFTAFPSADSAASGMLITAPAGTVAVTLNAETLNEPGRTVLDCGDYRRLESARTGVVLSQRAYGTIVLFHTGDETTSPIRHDYEICLLLNTDDSMLASGYFLTKGDGYDYTGSATVSNTVGVYRFPVMRIGTTADEGNTGNTYQTFGRIAQLSRGQQVTLLGYISDQNGALDSGYYFVSYTDSQGQTAYGYVPAAYILADGSGSAGGTQQISYRHLDRGERVTLYIGGDSANSSISLSNRELLKVYDDTLDEEGRIYVEYTQNNAHRTVYGGWIYESQLYEATPAVIAVLVVVCVVAIAVILSVCYLIFRKQPTLQ